MLFRSAAAEALCLISFFEGFGIPVIEAMQCGTPVICSNTTALNEIAADAAIKVAPDNIQAIAEALITIEQNFTLKTQLIEKGLRRAKDFSWDQTADRVAKAMELQYRFKISHHSINGSRLLTNPFTVAFFPVGILSPRQLLFPGFYQCFFRMNTKCKMI